MTKVELALDFIHTCSSTAQDRLWNSEKHLEEERIEESIKSKSENKESEKLRRDRNIRCAVGLYDDPPNPVGLTGRIGPG